MNALYLAAADLIVVVHAAYVGFVLFGLIAVLLGIVFRWRWVRNFWFRVIHFVMIAIVVGEALSGILCPLTTWEEGLREMAGVPKGVGGTFVGRLCDTVMFYRPTLGEEASGLTAEEFDALREKKFEALQRKLTIAYCIFIAAVLATLLLAPPRRPTKPRWLVSRWEKQALEGWQRRLRLDHWLSRSEVGWLTAFLSRVGETGRIRRARNRR
jgi:hypothetical protein